MTTRNQIETLFDSFFEFPTEDKSHVTSTSCKLFAEYCVEKLGQAVEQGKWVKFDTNNPTTYPQAGTHAFRYLVRTTNGVQKITTIAHWDGRYWFANQQNIDVTHWMPLPGFKECIK